jgi:transposase
MSIPVKLSEQVFKKYIEPHLTKAKRGYVCKIPLYKIFNYILYVLYTGCQWHALPIEPVCTGRNKQNNQLEKEISYQAVYYHFRKWSRDGSLKKVFETSIKTIRESLNLSEINFDGSHTISKNLSA